MKHVSHIFNTLDTLQEFLAADPVRTLAKAAQSTLVQIYAEQMGDSIPAITDLLNKALPRCVIVGATTCGELAQGRTLFCSTAIGISFFASTAAHAIALPCPPGDEMRVGAEMVARVGQLGPDVAALLLLSTPLSIDVSKLLAAMQRSGPDCPVFGGGAADYGAMATSFVLCDNTLYTAAAVAVALVGHDLHVELRTYLGWRPLSKAMTVTEVQGMVVKSVDGRPAFEVYERYLSIPNDRNFYTNTLEFPFLFERDGLTVSRSPVAVDAELGVQFLADIAEGEQFRIGYGSPEVIIADAITIQNLMRDFLPDAVFLYTCSCRRFFLLNDVELETLPFESVAPTFGFYTYGEFYGVSQKLHLLNSTMVAVGLREGPPLPQATPTPTLRSAAPSGAPDPLSNTHVKVVSRLVHFIGAVTRELESSNRELLRLSFIDRLTQTYNRAKLDAVLSDEVTRAKRGGSGFSVVLLDIDHFKLVNDRHGHLVGDAVLVRIARALESRIRALDTLGRWGGEEFLLVLPQTELVQATKLAEDLRKAVADCFISPVGQVTSSFGVTRYQPAEAIDTMLLRADEALYEAKRTGRNRVVAR